MNGGSGFADVLPGVRARLEANRRELLSPRDVGSLVRPASPNTALAAPDGFRPVADLISPTYAVSARKLYAVLRTVAAANPRTALDAAFDEALQAHYTVRSAVFGFPDLVWVQALEAEPDRSGALIWSRSVVGRYDLGVNKARVRAWLAAVDAALQPRKER